MLKLVKFRLYPTNQQKESLAKAFGSCRWVWNRFLALTDVWLDMGIKDFCVTSDGSKFANPRWLEKHERNLKNKQKSLSRKPQGSNNRNQARIKVKPYLQRSKVG